MYLLIIWSSFSVSRSTFIMNSKYSIGIYFMAMLTTRDKAPRVQQVALIPSDNLAVPMNFEPRPVSPKLTIKYWMVISIAKTAQYVGLLRIVLKMFISVTSFVSIILQFNELNKFMRMKVWKQTVSRIFLLSFSSCVV